MPMRPTSNPAVATRITRAMPIRPSGAFPAPTVKAEPPLPAPVAPPKSSTPPAATPPRAAVLPPPTTNPAAPRATTTAQAVQITQTAATQAPKGTPASELVKPSNVVPFPVPTRDRPPVAAETPAPAPLPAHGRAQPAPPTPGPAIQPPGVRHVPTPPAVTEEKPKVTPPPTEAEVAASCARQGLIWSPAAGGCVAYVQAPSGGGGGASPQSQGGSASGGSAGSVSIHTPAATQPTYMATPVDMAPKKSRTWLWVTLGVVGVGVAGGVVYYVAKR